MNILDLLKNNEDLLASIQDAGIPTDKIEPLASAVASQLGGAGGLDLSDLLGGLNLNDFLSKVDVGAVAEQIGLSPELVKQAVELIGPKVDEFVPGGLGQLGSIAGKLFD